jgi:predicted flavoprotein YhiN
MMTLVGTQKVENTQSCAGFVEQNALHRNGLKSRALQGLVFAGHTCHARNPLYLK